MRLAIAIEAPRVQRSGVFRGVLEGLPCDDDPAFLGVDHEGLMTGHVPRRRHDPDAGHDLRLAFEKLELRVAKVDDTFGHRVVGLPRGFVFDLLREDRHAGEAEVVARMIEVQVAVRDAAHILLLDAGLAQRRVELPPHRLVLRVDLGQAFPDAGVEEHRAARMEDEERVDDDGRTAEGQVRRRDEVTHVQADDVARAEDAHAVRRRGSSASRRESPNRLNPNTARLMATPGAIASQGARSRNCMPAPRSMRPHEGVGSNTPRPRNDREASRRIACPRNAVIMMRYGAKTFGATCTNMMRIAFVPTERVASMYGISTTDSALDRTTRETRGMIGTVTAAMTLAILSSPVPRAATTAMAMTMSGKESRTSMRRCLILSLRPPR